MKQPQISMLLFLMVLLKINSNQTFELNVISFNCVISLYHCNNNSNKFQIISRNNLNNIYSIQDLYLSNGNSNIYDILLILIL